MDDLQLSEGSGGVGTHKWQDWHWTQQESDFWTSKRLILEPLLDPYVNKKTITTEQRNLVKETIQSLREYSRYNVNGHRLMLKIAAFGDNHDWTIANIKFGTPLAQKASKGKSDSTGLHQPIVTIVKNILGEMELMVASSETPKKAKMPEGMKFAKIYRFIGATTSKDINDFNFYGNANRGKLLVNYKGVNLTGNTKLYACYS